MSYSRIQNLSIFTLVVSLIFSCFIVFSPTDSNAGGPILTIKKLTDPTTMSTFFDFTYEIDSGGSIPFS